MNSPRPAAIIAAALASCFIGNTGLFVGKNKLRHALKRKPWRCQHVFMCHLLIPNLIKLIPFQVQLDVKAINTPAMTWEKSLSSSMQMRGIIFKSIESSQACQMPLILLADTTQHFCLNRQTHDESVSLCYDSAIKRDTSAKTNLAS